MCEKWKIAWLAFGDMDACVTKLRSIPNKIANLITWIVIDCMIDLFTGRIRNNNIRYLTGCNQGNVINIKIL